MVPEEVLNMDKIEPEHAYITAGMDPKTQLFHSMYLRRHDTPSGSVRWLTSATGNVGFADADTAKMQMAAMMPNIPVFMSDEEGYAYPFLKDQ